MFAALALMALAAAQPASAQSASPITLVVTPDTIIEGQTAEVTATLASPHPMAEPTTVTVAALPAGADGAALSMNRVLILAAGATVSATSSRVVITTDDDSIWETDQMVEVSVMSVDTMAFTNATPDSVTLTIISDDPFEVADGGAGTQTETPTVNGQMVTLNREPGTPDGVTILVPTTLTQTITVTYGPPDSDDEVPESTRFGLGVGDDARTVVDFDVPQTLTAQDTLRICLPVKPGLRDEAGSRALVLLHSPDGSGDWREVPGSGPSADGTQVCGDVRDFSLFAAGYRVRDAAAIQTVSEVILPEFSRAMTESVVGAVSNRMSRLASDSGSDAMTSLTTVAGMLKANEQAIEDGTMSLRQVLGSTDFAFKLPGASAAGPGAGADDVTVWGSGDYRKLSGGDAGPVRWNGDFIGAHVGADARFPSRVLAGVALSRTDGKFDYTDIGDGEAVKGRYKSRMTSIHPYMGWTPREGSSVWATAGFGKGNVEITDSTVGLRKSDSNLWSAAAGGSVRGMEAVQASSRSPDLEDRMTLDLKGEAWFTQFDLKGRDGGLQALKVDTWRARLAAEGAYSFGLPMGASVTPSMELGVRWDGGDGETGGGVELGGGLDYANPSIGLSMDARGRALVAHQGNTDEWSVGGSVQLGSGSGRGLSLRMLPSYGETGSGASRLWERGVTDTAAGEPVARLDTELGYGVPAFAGLMKPYSSVVLSEGGNRGYRVGTRFTFGPAFDLSLEGERHESGAASSRPDHGVSLRGRVRW